MRIRFDFSDGSDQAQPRLYERPEAVYTAHRTGELASVLERVEAALAAGFHVAGFLSYEAAAALDPALQVHDGLSTLPLASFAAYSGPVDAGGLPADRWTLSDWQPDQNGTEYAAAVEAIRELIAAGETYQVNYSMRLRARLDGSAAALYRELLSRQPARYAALVETGSHALLSLSPELFFRRNRDQVITRPMKGTIQRAADPTEDARLQRELLGSDKDRAENVMITDLLRNDLGRIAGTGTVITERLLTLESLPTFHALTSQVRARVSRKLTLKELLTALYPCGSVTGAPKAATMGHIARLERAPRGAYCGTIGYCEPGGDWLFNVAIRTAQLDKADGTLIYGAGGGVTWGSTGSGEYREALLKASFLPGAPPEWRML